MNKWTRIIGASLALALASASFTAPLAAQSQREKQKRQEKKTPHAPPVAVINNPTPQYLSGEVSVTVRGNENPIIRLGLAQNGVALVEFPASDRFFAINPGNPDLVTVEDSPTKETDRFFVIRPGSGFAPSPEGAKLLSPATSIIVQMNSGMVVTFLLFPVRDIEQNAHRCVVMYDRDAIANARRAAGLVINLDTRDASSISKPPISSIRMPPDSPPQPQAITPSAQTEQPQAPTSTNGDPPKKTAEVQNARFEDVFPQGKEKWSKSQHGLRIAVQSRIIDAKHHQVAVTVRNTLDAPVKIVPGHPELQIQTLDDKGRVLQFEPVTRLKVASSVTDGMIAPKQTAHYLITYEAPVIGAKQRLGVAVAQINAADEPATMELTLGKR
ncbi:MAG: hypothetical protein AB7U82_12985 [Blastocatellales bacterium]